MGWTERSPEYVGERYDRLAPWYRAFEWGYALEALAAEVERQESPFVTSRFVVCRAVKSGELA